MNDAAAAVPVSCIPFFNLLLPLPPRTYNAGKRLGMKFESSFCDGPERKMEQSGEWTKVAASQINR